MTSNRKICEHRTINTIQFNENVRKVQPQSHCLYLCIIWGLFAFRTIQTDFVLVVCCVCSQLSNTLFISFSCFFSSSVCFCLIMVCCVVNILSPYCARYLPNRRAFCVSVPLVLLVNRTYRKYNVVSAGDNCVLCYYV